MPDYGKLFLIVKLGNIQQLKILTVHTVKGYRNTGNIQQVRILTVHTVKGYHTTGNHSPIKNINSAHCEMLPL